jgi:hypothetical protein
MKRPSAWAVKPYPTNHVRVYGIGADWIEKNNIPLESMMDNHKRVILFDNYTSKMRFDHEKDIFVIRYTCEDVYNESNVMIP